MRILVTGSRFWTARRVIVRAFSDALRNLDDPYPATLVHGACMIDDQPVGADWIADEIWSGWAGMWPELFKAPERYPATGFPSARARNQHMVKLGAAVCLSFADDWASGTGMCARLARLAGIPTIDYGVSTAFEAQPA